MPLGSVTNQLGGPAPESLPYVLAMGRRGGWKFVESPPADARQLRAGARSCAPTCAVPGIRISRRAF